MPPKKQNLCAKGTSRHLLNGHKYGIYRIIEATDKVTSDGTHCYFKCECLICGQIDYKTLWNIKHSTKCTHCITIGSLTLPRLTTIKDSRIRGIFRKMIVRCYDAEDKHFSVYGAKGIKICDEWLNNPAEFEKWSLENGYKDFLTIDRILEEKDYSPDNCRWVTKSENSKWTTKTIRVTARATMTIPDWAKLVDEKYITLKKIYDTQGLTALQEYIESKLMDKRLLYKGELVEENELGN